MFVGQLAVMANGIIDTVMAGHLSAQDLAAAAIGASIYDVVFVALMGTLQAISPVAAQHFGASRPLEVGHAWRQGQWLAAFLLLPGWVALAFPQPMRWLARSEPAVADTATLYLTALAFGPIAAVACAALALGVLFEHTARRHIGRGDTAAQAAGHRAA
jgi:MATE family multidrug resistance protein